MQTAMFKEFRKKFWFESENCSYTVVNDEDSLSKLAEYLSKQRIISIDVETTGLDPRHSDLVGIGFCSSPGIAFYVPVNNFGTKLSKEIIVKYLGGVISTIPCLGHNLKFDYKFILHHLGISILAKHDTYVITRLLDKYEQAGLKYLGYLIFGHEVQELSSLLKMHSINNETLNTLTAEEVCAYCCQDVDLTLRLFMYFYNDLKWRPSFIYDVEIGLIENLSKVELRGIRVSRAFFDEMLIICNNRIEEREEQVYKILNKKFNLNSSSQFGKAFFDMFPGFKNQVYYTEKSKTIRMTEKDVVKYKTRFDSFLESSGISLEKNVFKLLLDRKEAFSMKTKYLEAWLSKYNLDEEPFIYTSFNSLGTVTGRMSSDNPNMQNLSPEMKKAIIPREGYYFCSLDFQQVEYRILAAVAGLDHLVEEMNKGSCDIHTLAAKLLFDTEDVSPELRKKAKTLNFGVLYRMGVKKLSDMLNISDEEAAELKELYDSRFLKNTDWFDRVIKFAKKNGYVLTSFGRKRRIDNINLTVDYYSMDESEIKEAKKLLGEARRQAINTPIQGTSADITKLSVNKVCSYIRDKKLDIHLLAIVHDEFLFEVSNKYPVDKVVTALKECIQLKFKDKIWLTLDAKVSKISWGEMEKVDV